MYNLSSSFREYFLGFSQKRIFDPPPPPIQKGGYQIVQFKLCDLHIGNLVHITFTLFDMDSFDGEGVRVKKFFCRIDPTFFRTVPFLFFGRISLDQVDV